MQFIVTLTAYTISITASTAALIYLDQKTHPSRGHFWQGRLPLFIFFSLADWPHLSHFAQRYLAHRIYTFNITQPHL